MDFPNFTDLEALAAQLEKHGKNRKLKHALNQAWRAQSCLGDLRQAEECCEILTEVIKRPREHDTSEWITTERALLSTAISLYARATATSAKQGDRGAISLAQGKLSSEEWADHVALVNVRNQALAHVYSSQPISGQEWHRSIFFAVELKPGYWKAASASNQVGFHMATFLRIKRMVPVALKLINDQFQKRMKAVEGEIGTVSQAELLDHKFDPVRVFGSEQGVSNVLSGAGKASTSYWWND